MVFIIKSKNQTIMIKQLFLVFLTCLLILGGISQALPFTSNKALFLNERYNIEISETNAAIKNNAWGTNAANFTVNYPNYFIADSVMPNLYLGDFDFRNIEKGVSCIIQPVNLTETGFIFNVKTSNSSSFSKLSINYLLIYSLNNFYDKFYVKGNLLTVNKNISKDVKTSYSSSAALPANFSTDGLVIRSFFSGFQIKPTTQKGDLDLAIASRIYNSSHYQILISSSATQPTNVATIRALFIIFNQKFMETNQQEFGYRFFSGTVKSTAKKSELSFKNEHQAQSTNTIIGLSAFSLEKQTKFGFSASFDQSTIKVTSVSPVTSFAVNYIVVQSTYCGYDAPYLQFSSNTCYLECPGTTVHNEQYFSCDCYIEGFYEQDTKKCLDAPVRLLQIQPVSENTPPSNPMERIISKYLN